MVEISSCQQVGAIWLLARVISKMHYQVAKLMLVWSNLLLINEKIRTNLCLKQILYSTQQIEVIRIKVDKNIQTKSS